MANTKRRCKPIEKHMFCLQDNRGPYEIKMWCKKCRRFIFVERIKDDMKFYPKQDEFITFYRWRVWRRIVKMKEKDTYPPCPVCGKDMEAYGRIYKYNTVMCPSCRYTWGARVRSDRLCCPKCNKNFTHDDSAFHDPEAIEKIIVAVTKCLSHKKTKNLSIDALQKYILRQNKLYNESRFRKALNRMDERGEGMYDNDGKKPGFIIIDECDEVEEDFISTVPPAKDSGIINYMECY